LRGSRTSERDVGAPFIPLHVLVAHRPSREGYVPRNSNGTLVMAPHPRRGSGECAVPPLEIGIQAVSLSPYHAGLAGRHRTRLLIAPASPTCSCPLQLSPSGQSDDPDVSLRTSPDGVEDSAPRPAAHCFHARGSSVRCPVPLEKSKESSSE